MKKSLGFVLGAAIIGFASVTAVQAETPPSGTPGEPVEMISCFQESTQIFNDCMKDAGGDPDALLVCLAEADICRPTEN